MGDYAVTQKIEPAHDGATHLIEQNKEDDDEQERREIIQQCLASGLEEDRIMEILEEWQCEKMCRNFREKEQKELQPRQEKAGPQRTSPNGTSLAASRQAK